MSARENREGENATAAMTITGREIATTAAAAREKKAAGTEKKILWLTGDVRQRSIEKKMVVQESTNNSLQRKTMQSKHQVSVK